MTAFLIFIVIVVGFNLIPQLTKKEFSKMGKIITVLILIPMILLCLFTLLFGRTIYEHRVTDNLKIGVSTGGIMTCGEHIVISERKLGIFDKEIYHDGEWDSETPYLYEIENKNVW